MLHPLYHVPGTTIILPELSGVIGLNDPTFRVRKVMEGGMGICLHIETHDGRRQFALKSPRPDLLGDPDSTERFNDELKVWMAASACSFVAEALAIVRINSLPTVCATWMEGGDYASKIRSLPRNIHLTNLLRIVRGLRWVYDNHGVIHRDLKPQNLLLDTTNIAYVADWGLARPVAEQMRQIRQARGEGFSDPPDRTVVGTFVGTVVYAAPEQIRGENDIDFRADIYALGCIMFEMETGSPPFLGHSCDVVAYHHLHTPPPRIDGSQHGLGLEHIIAKCLQKAPEQRYLSYAELEEDLMIVAKRAHADLENINGYERYERNVIGQGNLKRDVQVKGIVGTRGYAVIDLDHLLPHSREAEALMALSRFAEARVILEPLYVPETLRSMTEWSDVFHVAPLNLAQCIGNIENIPQRAIDIFEKLSHLTGKPPEFYVNYSFVLNKCGRSAEAKDICDQGLADFPNDLGIIGNRTISLNALGDMDGAWESASLRLSLRRDTNSLEEACAVLISYAHTEKNSDLPGAFAKAQQAMDFVNEGLLLNPQGSTLRTNKAGILSFVGIVGSAIDIYDQIIGDDSSHLSIKHFAFSRLVELYEKRKDIVTALNLIREHGHRCSTPGYSEKLKYLENRILADHFMIGRTSSDGARLLVREPIDFFLHDSVREGRFMYQIEAARILEWMGRRDEAIRAVEQVLAGDQYSWDAASCMAQFLSRWGRHDEALLWADHLIAVGPWKAESYDIASFTYRQSGNIVGADSLKKEGDLVFAEETRLREAFRVSL